jgi:hypothetical protein
VLTVLVSTVPNDGCLNFVDENDEVLLAGFGRKGKAKGDIPGVRFKGEPIFQFPNLRSTLRQTLIPIQSSRFPVSVSSLSGRRRRRSPDHKGFLGGTKRSRSGHAESTRLFFTLALRFQVDGI